MQKRILQVYLIAVLQLATIVAFSQQEDVIGKAKKNYIQFNLGLIHPRLMDEAYSKKLLFRGTNWKFGLGYGRETNKYRLSFSTEGSVGKVESKSGHLPSDFYFIQASLEYLMKIRQVQLFGRQSTPLAGLSLASTNYIIINQPIFDNASVLSLHGVYFNLGGQLHLSEKNHLQLIYRLPTAVYTNHLVWNGGASDLTFDDQEHLMRTLTTRGSYGYFDLFSNVQLIADYELRLGRSAHFTAGYKFVYVSSSSATSANIYSNELLMGLKIRF
jgi:hypothetical protein